MLANPVPYLELDLLGANDVEFLQFRSLEAVQCLADPATSPPTRVMSLVEEPSGRVLDVRRKDGGCITCLDVLEHIAIWVQSGSHRSKVRKDDSESDDSDHSKGARTLKEVRSAMGGYRPG